MKPPMQTKLLSTHLGKTRADLEAAGILDTVLGIDTKLFVDPKLLVNCPIPEFKESRITLIKYFAQLLKVHKSSAKAEQLMDLARSMLAVKEPIGLSIGYGSKSDKGTAISESVANRILKAASEILAVGIDDEELVELMGLFVSGFGPDSMSDLVVSILYKDFCEYTQRQAEELGVHTKKYTIDDVEYDLPEHPFKGTQVIFVPHSLVRPLPIAVSWEDIQKAARHNHALRSEFNKILMPALQESVAELSEKSEGEKQVFREGFNALLDVYRRLTIKPYNLKSDSKGYYLLSPFAEQERQTYTSVKTPTDQEQLIAAVRGFIKQYERSIAHNGGNKLLYKRTDTGALLKDKPHNEDVAQILFYLLADEYCSKANILLSREPNAGLGPVDFSLGKAYDNKVLVEIKKSTNRELRNGYEKQLTAYQKSESAHFSFYVVLLVKEIKKRKGAPPTDLDLLTEQYEKNKAAGVKTPELIIIDALVYSSPSKLR